MRIYKNHPIIRATAHLVVGTMTLPMLLAGCGGQPQSAQPQAGNPPPPPIDDTRSGRMAPPVGRAPVAARPGISTKQKVMILAGAAALYYIYHKHQQKMQAQGQTIQYYRSKNGRVYYREPNNPQQVHWVTPPTKPMRVEVDPGEVQQYSDIEGYNNQSRGRGIDDLFPLPSAGQQ